MKPSLSSASFAPVRHTPPFLPVRQAQLNDSGRLRRRSCFGVVMTFGIGIPLLLVAFAIVMYSRQLSIVTSIAKDQWNPWEVVVVTNSSDRDTNKAGAGWTTTNDLFEENEIQRLQRQVSSQSELHESFVNATVHSSPRDRSTNLTNNTHSVDHDDIVVVAGLASPLLRKYQKKQKNWTMRTEVEVQQLIPTAAHFYLEPPPSMSVSRDRSTENTTTSVNSTLSNSSSALLPFCLAGKFYGQTNNRILTLARIVHRAKRFRTKVGLSSQWSSWVRQYLDLGPYKDDVLYDYFDKSAASKNPCFRRLKPIQAYRLSNYEIIPELQWIRPHARIQHLAETYLKENYQKINSTYSFVSVHRRNFDGVCMRRAFQHRIGPLFCPSVVSKAMCNASYPDIARAQQRISNSKVLDTSNVPKPIILFTDNQNPTFDDTFPESFSLIGLKDNAKIGDIEQEAITDKGLRSFSNPQNEAVQMLLEMWIMKNSQMHYGTPESTVDKVLYHWRNYSSIEPSVCFPDVSISVATEMNLISNFQTQQSDQVLGSKLV